MSSFRFKVLLFMLPLLLPIGRVEITGQAQSDTDRTPSVRPIERIESPESLAQPVRHDLVVNSEATPAP